MEVSIEVEIDVCHGSNLGHSPSCGSSLNSKDRSHAGLPQGQYSLLAYPSQSVTQSNGSSGLSFSKGSWSDCCDQNQLSVLLPFIGLQKAKVYLRLFPSVAFNVFFIYSCSICYGSYIFQYRRICYLDVASHFIPSINQKIYLPPKDN